MTSPISVESVPSLYVDLLKQTLTRSLDADHFRRIPRNNLTFMRAARSTTYSLVQAVLAPFHLALVQETPRTGETMIGVGGLDNIEACVTEVIREGVPGDLVETGVWRGGAVIFMRALLEVFGEPSRLVWAFDSFAGLPKPDEAQYPADKGDRLWSHSLAVSLEEVKDNFRKYNMLDDRVRFVEGWFRDTVPSAPVASVAVLRLDGDMYESTMQVLEGFYPRVSVGGYVIIDDYNVVRQCNLAVDEFRAKHNIQETLVELPGNCAYWKRT